jgi:fucose permease
VREHAPITTRWLTAASWLSFVVFATCSTLVPASLQLIGRDLGADYGRLGALASWRAAALVAGALVSGLLSERFGKRWFLGGGMMAIAVGLAWSGGVQSYWGLVAGLLCMGVGLGCLEALVSPLAADLHPRDLSVHMNVLHAFFPAGIVLCALPLGWGLDHGLPWQTPFAIVSLPAAVVGLMYLTGRYPTPVSAAASPAGGAAVGVRSLLRERLFYVLAGAMVVGGGCEGGLFFWSSKFIEAEYHLGALAGAAALALFSLAMVVGRFGCGALARRGVPIERQVYALTALGAVACALLMALHSPAGSLALIAAGGACVAFFWPAVLVLATEKMATSSSTLFALLAVAGITGYGLVPGLMGAAAEDFGLRAALALVPASFVLTGVLLHAVFRLSR